MLTVKHLSKKLNVSSNTIYRMVSQNNVPFFRIGNGRGTIRFDEKQINKWLKDRMNETWEKKWDSNGNSK